jgi:glyoxylase-like metal-dependent hydrolase (beta-lactamase superfamily II)
MNIIPIKLSMTKAILIKDQKNLLVDTGNPKDYATLWHFLDANLEDGEPLDYILITHAHLDHYGCAAALHDKTGAKVIIHERDYETMKLGYNSPIVPFSFTGKLLSPFIKKDPKKIVANPVKADIVIKDEETDLHPFGIAGKVVATPGHTPGSISLFLDDQTAIVGDLMMSFLIPEKPEKPLFAYNVDEWKKSLKKVLEFEPKKIIITHGNFYTYNDFKSFCKKVFKKN